MATVYKGLTIEINGDTTGLNTALKNVNSEVKSVQSQLKNVEKGLKLDPTNTELLAEKQKLLKDAVNATAQKLDVLKTAEEQLKASGVDQNSAQFRALHAEVVTTQKELEKATKEAERFSAEIVKTAGELKKVSDAAGTVADKTKALSAAAAGALGGIAGLALNAASTADDLNTLAKQTGFTTDELQKMQYASDLVDVSVEDITGSMKKLKANMTSSSSSVTEAFALLGVNVRGANGELRDANDVFYETISRLSYVTNETERDTLAMTLFGKSADSLAGIIDDGGAALKQYGQEAEAMGLILSGDTLNALNDVNDKIDKVKATAKATLTEAGAKAMGALLPVLESIVSGISNVLEWVGNLSTSQIAFIVTILAVVAAISPIAGIISGITGAISSLIGLFPAIKAGITAIQTFATANPIVLIAAAIIALVALIIANWDKIKAVLDAIWEKVQDVFGKIKDFIMGVIDAIKEVFKNIGNFFIGIVNAVIKGINWLIDKINSIKVDIPDWIPGIGGKSIGFNLKPLNEIPALASGGVVANGSAIVGEAGAELLTVNNGRAQVQPLTNVTNNTFNQLPNNPIEVSVNLDGRVLARQLVRPLEAASRIKGGSCIV